MLPVESAGSFARPHGGRSVAPGSAREPGSTSPLDLHALSLVGVEVRPGQPYGVPSGAVPAARDTAAETVESLTSSSRPAPPLTPKISTAPTPGA